ncbi:MAG: SprT family zinc-dependent metalloprotease [Minisyncoccia bacterium]
MEKNIELQDRKIPYTLKVSPRIRRLRLSIFRDGNFVVTVPRTMSENTIEQFIIQKSQWIIKKLEYFKGFSGMVFMKSTKKEYVEHKERALILAQTRLEYFNQFYNFSYNKISIKNQKTKWGSCSKRRNLNFNYKIALLPEKMADYIIVHELCHLGQFNHSKNFWSLVAQTIPDHHEIRKDLKKNGSRIR